MIKKNNLFIVILLAILSFSLIGCFSSESSNDSNNVSLEVLLTDTPISEIDSLYIDIKDIYFKYNIDGETKISTSISINKKYDILSLAGKEQSLFTIHIPKGSELKDFYINIDKNATVVVNGDNKAVSVNSNGNLIIPNLGIYVTNDGELLIDFDVVESLKYTKDGFTLNPILKTTFRRKNATDIFKIEGKVLDIENIVEKAVITLSTTTLSNEATILKVSLTDENGNFYLGKHNNGEYDIKIYRAFQLSENEGEIIDFDSLVSDYSTTVSVNSEDVNITINLEQE